MCIIIIVFIIFYFSIFFPEVKKVLLDRDTMRKQAESLKDEYDRLSEEYQKLQV